MNFNPFLIHSKSTILQALKKIEMNNKGFLIVVNSLDQVVGTITDGDIRRAFIHNYTTDDYITTVFNKDFVYVSNLDSFNKIVHIFKSSKIEFLPILNKEKKLENMITKKQFHAALMEDITFTLDFNFLHLDELTVDHEIFNRPWGFYKTTFLNPYARAKIIKVFPNEELSLQEHKKREEHWIVIAGKGRLIIGESERAIQPGDYIFIPKACKHKVINTCKINSLMISEVQLGEYFGEDDIIRYDDKYGRIV